LIIRHQFGTTNDIQVAITCDKLELALSSDLYNYRVKQINITVTPEFEADLRTYMERRKLTRESDAVHMALRELASSQPQTGYDYRSWIGFALAAPQNPKPLLSNEDDLWS
jgi:hypothetical protein